MPSAMKTQKPPMQVLRRTLDCLTERRLRGTTWSAEIIDILLVFCAISTELCASSWRFRGIPLRCIQSFRLSVRRSCDFLSRHAGGCPCAGTCGAPIPPSIGYLPRPASSDSSRVTWRLGYGGGTAFMRVLIYVHRIAGRSCMSTSRGRIWSIRLSQANRIWTWTKFWDSSSIPDMAPNFWRRMSSLM